MKDISQVTACFIDHGLFIPLARKFAEKANRVLYWSPYEEGFSSIRKGIIGDGFSDIERCPDFWKLKDEIDLFVFPDIEHSGLQLELEFQGKAVWGSRSADSIELNREKFLNILKEYDLDVPSYEVVTGLSELRRVLRGEGEKYIKISRWRGDMETSHWRGQRLDEGLLDRWAVKFGAAKEAMRFLVFDPIETDLEIGGDTYCVDGAWPDTMLNGIEWKDKGYFSAVTPTVEMPEQVQAVLKAFGQVLKPYRYRNEFSSELRVTDTQAFFIDPTCRGGLPSTGSQMECWENFAEIIWSGANGELVNPIPRGKFTAECVITAKCEKGEWLRVEVPSDMEPYMKLASCCEIDGLVCFPPSEHHEDEIGWLVAVDDTPGALIEQMKDLASRLPDGVSANVECLADIIKEVESAEDQGVPITEEAMPEPAIVLEEDN